MKLLKAAFVVLGLFVSVEMAHAKIHGPFHDLHPVLKKRLVQMQRHFGRKLIITPNGGCRKRGNRLAPRSYHRIAVGCKAADVIIPGVSKHAILAYWGRHFGGGRGYYCGRPFVHVDIGPSRTWRWFCGNGKGRKRYYAKKRVKRKGKVRIHKASARPRKRVNWR